MVPDAMSAAAWLVRAPAARAISRAVKTSGTTVMTEDMGSCPFPKRKTLADHTDGGAIAPACFSAVIREIC